MSNQPKGSAERCQACGCSLLTADNQELRCACGSLLARRVPGGIELKCRRCKRPIVVAVDHISAADDAE